MSRNSKISTKLPPGVSIPQKSRRTSSPELSAELLEELKAELKAELKREAAQELKAELQAQEKAVIAKEAKAQSDVTDKEQPVFKDSFFSAKLRQQEEARKRGDQGKRGEQSKRKPAGNISSYNELMMEDMWKEMEAQISYSVPKGKALPQDFLRSIGMSGEQVMISPKAIAILKKMMEES